MKIKRYKDNIVQWHLIYDDVDEWVNSKRLLNMFPDTGLTEKQLYDRLNRLDKKQKTRMETVYLCASTPPGNLRGSSGKQPVKSTGFASMNLNLGVLGL